MEVHGGGLEIVKLDRCYWSDMKTPQICMLYSHVTKPTGESVISRRVYLSNLGVPSTSAEQCIPQDHILYRLTVATEHECIFHDCFMQYAVVWRVSGKDSRRALHCLPQLCFPTMYGSYAASSADSPAVWQLFRK